jgi:hypothetical protein
MRYGACDVTLLLEDLATIMSRARTENSLRIVGGGQAGKPETRSEGKLPLETTSFVGRGLELSEVEGLLGLLPLIEAAGAVPNDIDVWTRWGWIRNPEGVPYGYNIRRQALDPLLRRLAAQTPGVDLMLGQSAHRLLRGGDDETGWISGVAIRNRAGETREISARLVVAADGRDARGTGRSSQGTTASSPTSPQRVHTIPSRGSCSRRRQGTSGPQGTSTRSAPAG